MIDTSDPIGIESLLTAEEIALRDDVGSFVDTAIKPNIAHWHEDAVFLLAIVPEMAKLGLLSMQSKGYGCPGRSAVEYGLAAMELEVGDSGLRTFVSVQWSLAVSASHKHGSEEQKNQWLPLLAASEAIGCFGLTEPTAGSDPGSMKTFARQEGGDWVLNGTKRWIGLASVAQVAVIWAMTSDGVRGFVVPTDTPGFTATAIEQKLSMRASIQCDIELTDVRLPAEALLPKARGLRGPFECLNEACYGIIWGAMGAARDSYLTVLEYSTERIQFDKPLAGYQLTQEKLVNMALEINKGTLLALQIGRLKDAGTLQPHQISVGKLNNCREAIQICRDARAMLGGNGITLDYSPMRHANNLESQQSTEAAITEPTIDHTNSESTEPVPGIRHGIKRPPTAQAFVLAELRRTIIAGELSPGQPLRQDLLAERFGVSWVPLREALSTLEAEGQVVYEPHRGYEVATLSLGDLTEVYRLRQLLEAEAVRAAVKMTDDSVLSELEKAAKEVEIASAAGDLMTMTDANRRFHFVITAAVGMPRPERIVRVLWDATDAYRFVYYGDETNRRGVEHEHTLVIKAFADRDTERLIAMLDEHREHAVEALRKFLDAV